LQRNLKRQLVIGIAALAVAAFAGVAYAATKSSTPNTRQAFLNDVAKRLDVTPQQLTAALNGATLDQVQAAVKAGRLTQAQANKLKQHLQQKGAAPAVPFGLGPGLARPGGPGGPRGPWGPGGPGGPGVFGGHIGGPFELQAASSYLGLTIPQLLQQLSSGKSLAQIASSKGKTVSVLEQAMTSAIKARLDKLVANKMMTATQEKTLLSRLSARLSKVVNQKGLPLKRPAFRFPHGMPTPPKQPGGKARPNGPIPPAYAPVPYAAPTA
jgi:hypothetical protein